MRYELRPTFTRNLKNTYNNSKFKLLQKPKLYIFFSNQLNFMAPVKLRFYFRYACLYNLVQTSKHCVGSHDLGKIRLLPEVTSNCENSRIYPRKEYQKPPRMATIAPCGPKWRRGSQNMICKSRCLNYLT